MRIHVLRARPRPHRELDKVGEEEIPKGRVHAGAALELDIHSPWWHVLRAEPESEVVPTFGRDKGGKDED